MAKKFNVNISEDEIREILVEEINKLDWLGRKVEIDGRMTAMARLQFILEEPMALAYADTPLVQFFPRVIKGDFKNVPAYAAILDEGWVGKTVRFINRVVNMLGWKCISVSTSREALRELLKSTVKHENRHIQQYEFLSDHGLNAAEIVNKQNEQFSYLDRPFEKDAIDYSMGKVNDLEKIFAQYL